MSDDLRERALVDLNTPSGTMRVRALDVLALTADNEKLRADNERLGDLAYLAWTVIANAHGGNWGEASNEWRGAAIRWRDQYHAALSDTPQEADRG